MEQCWTRWREKLPELCNYLESQSAKKNRPLDPKAVHNHLKVAPDSRPLPFQVGIDLGPYIYDTTMLIIIGYNTREYDTV